MEGLGLFTVFTIIAVIGCLIAILFAVVSEKHMRLIVSVSIGVLLLIVGGGAVTGAYDADNQVESAATNEQKDDVDYDAEADDDSDAADDDTSTDDSDYEDESSTDTTSTEDDSLDEDTDTTTEADTTSSSSSVVAASSSSYTAPVSSSSSYRAPSSSASSRVTNGYHQGGGRSYAYKPVPQTGQTETVYVSAQIPGRYHKDPNCRGLARYGGAQAVSLARAQQMGYTAFCAYERYGR